MKWNELARLLVTSEVRGDPDTEFTGICVNSKLVRPGDLFVCISGGLQADRHSYAAEAVRAGAAGLIVERDVEGVGKEVPTIKVRNARHALAVASCHFYGYPSRELKLIGVTGTNGKTTTAHMIEALLSHAGHITGLMGNIGTKIAGEWAETDINTQEPHRLQANLRNMKDRSAEFAVMEATSQGIHFGRVLGCEFRTAVFTNLTQDHLDYHGTMERYREAKGLLFSRLGNGFSTDPAQRRFAVLNADDPASDYFRGVTAAHTLLYAIGADADVNARNIRLTGQGTSFDVVSFAGEASFDMKMVGRFNVYNALAAITTALAEGIPIRVIRDGLRRFPGVPGRMEVVDEGQSFLVLADYAHTPDSLDKALSTVREFAERSVIVVFGCGGDRDAGKRPIMGKLAARWADYVIVTSDNPRSEEPDRIMRDIESGLAEDGVASDRYALIADRRRAIAAAIESAEPGDVVLIAGKGHETYQILREGTIPFDDREEARQAIRSKLGKNG